MGMTVRAINFGHFLRWRQEELGLTVKEFAELAGYSERQMLSIQKNYPTAERIQGTKMAVIAKAAGYSGRAELDKAWRETAVPEPDFRRARDDGRINVKARVTPQTRAEILKMAAKHQRTIEDVAGDVLDGAFSLTSSPAPAPSATAELESRHPPDVVYQEYQGGELVEEALVHAPGPALHEPDAATRRRWAAQKTKRKTPKASRGQHKGS